ncbi:MAG TPA: hypothetical protein VFR86_18790, partial [Burkholderiaceae bacterium]|nr:hypothetical protein [Burkholderiaceae bacterium]
HASPLLVLLALWWFAQIYPTPMLFAFGSSDGGLLETARDLGFGLPARGNWSAADFVLAEAVVATAGVLAAGLAAAAAMTLHAPRLRLLVAFIFMALAVKSLAYGVRFGPERWLAWVTPGAVGGLALGVLALMVAATGRQRAIARLALAATLCLLLAVGLVPDNPYFSNWIEQWRTGRLTHFNAAAEWIALAWPFALSMWLVFASLGRRP